ncbi:TPA: hypothetical protein H1Q11_005419 [Salmonella enterica]|nr:hypothetical protein [Salmonella enterica]HAK1939312.1 hypothetical protein [Salmonella enterica]
MRQVPFEVMTHAENALSESECAYEVLNMWLDSLTDSKEDHSEACRVSAIMTLLHNSIGELEKAREAYSAK